MKLISAILLVVLALFGCSRNEVSFETLEAARSKARENASQIASAHRMSDPSLASFRFTVDGDSSQTNTCPQGDGWSTVKFTDGTVTRVFKCSTVSKAIGCIEQSEFVKKPFAIEDKSCQPVTKVPHPLPNLDK